jgi:hypothetical protein
MLSPRHEKQRQIRHDISLPLRSRTGVLVATGRLLNPPGAAAVSATRDPGLGDS